MKKTFILFILFSLFASFEAYADFRCQGRFINSTYSKLDVKKYCGEPVMVDSYTKTETISFKDEDKDVSCITVDQWYYSYGPNKTTYIIDFEGGFAVRVRQGRDKP